MSNGCRQNEGYFYQMHDCEKIFMDGLVSNGLAGAISHYVTLTRGLAVARELEVAAAAAGGPPLIPQSFLVGAAGAADLLGSVYLAGGLRFHARARKAAGEASISTFISSSILVTIASIVSLLALYVALYSPMLRVLDQSTKQVGIRRSSTHLFAHTYTLQGCTSSADTRVALGCYTRPCTRDPPHCPRR